MTDALTTERLQTALDGGDFDALRRLLENEHAADLAPLLKPLDAGHTWQLLQLLPLPAQAEIFGYLDAEHQLALAALAGRRRLAGIVSHMEADERADLFNQLPEDQREALLPALAQAEREDIRRLAAYEEGTAGAIMTSDYAALHPELTAREAIDSLRREAPDKETIYIAYVLDSQRRLLGTLSLRELILAPPQQPIAELMESEPVCAHVNDAQDTVVRQIAKYDLMALPVVDDHGLLVGIVTYDDAMDVAEEEATESMHRVGSVGPLEGSLSRARLPTLYRKRIFWLALLVFGNVFSGAGIAYFEGTIAAHVALVFFLPMLIGSAGNAGSQAATLMVRALATGDVALKDWGTLLGREILVAGALGLTMAVLVSGIGIVRGGPDIALIVASTMLAVVIVGSLIGAALPFLLTRLQLDPATASAPLVATIADATGVLIYFSIATVVLSTG